MSDEQATRPAPAGTVIDLPTCPYARVMFGVALKQKAPKI